MQEADDAAQALEGLPTEVSERVMAELPDRGEKIVAALRTAAFLIDCAVHDRSGLRLPESAVYNLREALDAVVTARKPGTDRLAAVVEAWEDYELETRESTNDHAASLSRFRSVVQHASQRRDRSSYHAGQLLGYLVEQTGVEPLTGERDPVAEYNRLRNSASGIVHTNADLAAATALYDRTLQWFIRMFTPADETVKALRALARQPWTGSEKITHLQRLATTPHHLRMFLAHVTDARWLPHLHRAGLLPLPEPATPWPVHGLGKGLANTDPAAVADILCALLADCNSIAVEQRLDARFDILRLATQLGPSGYPVIGAIVAKHPDQNAVRSLAAAVAHRADPSESLIEQVGRAVLNVGPNDRNSYGFRSASSLPYAPDTRAGSLSGSPGEFMARFASHRPRSESSVAPA